MIHYQLQCTAGHAFDGWFQSSTSFERQAADALLECPDCGSHQVDRAVMAPRIGGKATAPAAITTPPSDSQPPEAPSSPGTAVAGRMPDGVRALFARLRREVETNCDYVGPAFATEARRIHDGETEPRGIYGEATDAEAEALAEEGIGVSRIPWVPRADS